MITFEELFDAVPREKEPFHGRVLHRFAEHTDACEDDATEYCGHDDLPAQNLDEAELVSSPLAYASGRVSNLHAPVIDIDLPCDLVESSPDHHHLYINHAVKWDDYLALLEAMAKCGIVQAGYVEAARRRGYTSVRHPNKPKQ